MKTEKQKAYVLVSEEYDYDGLENVRQTVEGVFTDKNIAYQEKDRLNTRDENDDFTSWDIVETDLNMVVG